MRRAILTTALFAAFALAAPATPALAADLAVKIEGLRSEKGTVRIAIYDDSRRFLKDGGQVANIEVDAEIAHEGTVTGLFRGLPPGRYAMVVHHDENRNDEMDTSFIGLPLEGYGFSNDVPVFLSAPAFEEAAFDIRPGIASIALRLVY